MYRGLDLYAFEYYNSLMRTTIELTDEQRSALLALAGKRGLRGYSSLVQEALAQYMGLPVPSAPPRRPASKRKDRLLEFLTDGFSTGRKDGAESHDDYIYRGG